MTEVKKINRSPKLTDRINGLVAFQIEHGDCSNGLRFDISKTLAATRFGVFSGFWVRKLYSSVLVCLSLLKVLQRFRDPQIGQCMILHLCRSVLKFQTLRGTLSLVWGDPYNPNILQYPLTLGFVKLDPLTILSKMQVNAKPLNS